MTHTRNTAASDPAAAEIPANRRPIELTAASRTSASTPHDHATSRPAVRRVRGRRGRTERTLPVDGQTGRAYRARTEPMTVRPLRDGRYVVETDGGTYVVDVERESCTCPDSAIRGARCKHRRRVELEIDARLVPGPNERERVCAVCGGRAFVPIETERDSPVLCERHDRAPGDLVRDRETGSLLVVVDALGQRADATRTEEGRLVSAYETNAAYGGHEPVFAAVYVGSLSDDIRSATETGSDDGHVADVVADARRYLFPASRLRPVADARKETDLEDVSIDLDDVSADLDDVSALFAVVADVSEA
ncbi:SWIM zinc finger family protein [Halobellus salinisoli]|uniref:SWIM zinc finger family protein n=1 Tax=Halobellus salinisoli TaxID=3108500 RepID=UPI003CE5AE66